MKKLRKRNYLINDTVEVFACSCGCDCGIVGRFRAEERVDDKVYLLETDY